MNEDIPKITLKKGGILIKKDPSYFKPKEGQFSTRTLNAEKYEVGTIIQVGANLNPDWIGKTIYYFMNIASEVKFLDSKNTYELISEEQYLLIIN